MKKILAMLLALVMVLSLAACGGTEADPTEAPAANPTEAPAAEGDTPATEAPAVETAAITKVALVTDVGTIDDESFNQACWEGVVAWCTENNVEYTYYQPKEDSTDARVLSIAQAISEGYNTIVMPGFLFNETVPIVQETYPDAYFIAVDVAAADVNPTANTACITFAEEQAGYLAGYAAVKDGYTKLGYLGGQAVPAVIRYGYGFIQGADAAAAELGVNIEINYTYGGQFFGSPEITAKMEGWYQAGTEVVFACGGGIYTSALEAAEKNNGKVIGVDSDQGKISPLIITSAMKLLKDSVVSALDGLNNGEWANFGGKQTVYDLTMGDVVGLPTAEESWRLTTFTVEEYQDVKVKIADGTIVISNDIEALPALSEYTTVNEIA